MTASIAAAAFQPLSRPVSPTPSANAIAASRSRLAGSLNRSTCGSTIASVTPWGRSCRPPIACPMACTRPSPVVPIPMPAICDASSIADLASRSAPSATLLARCAPAIAMTWRAIPSAHGLARTDRYDSMAWVSASTPVAAVAAGGRPTVSSGSSMAAAGIVLACPT